MFQLFIDYKFNFHFVIVSFQKYYHLLFFFKPRCVSFFALTLWLSQLTATTRDEFKSMNWNAIVYSYLSTPIGKQFLVGIFLFCSLPIKFYFPEFFEFSLATTITVLTPVSCDHVHHLVMRQEGKGCRPYFLMSSE